MRLNEDEIVGREVCKDGTDHLKPMRITMNSTTEHIAVAQGGNAWD